MARHVQKVTRYPQRLLIPSFVLIAAEILGCKTSLSRSDSSSQLLAVPTASSVPTATFPKRNRHVYESYGAKYMVVSQGDATTRAARKMLELGGNAIDAAVAASFTVAVERPQSTGLAGGGFMLIHVASTKDMLAVDFREVAPAKATHDMYLDRNGQVIPGSSADGGLASGVPGMVAGVLAVHEKYGRLARATVMQPAIELAEKGYAIYPHLAAALDDRKDVLKNSPEALITFFDQGVVPKPLTLGKLLVQPALGKVLRQIAGFGKDGFYKGWVAEAIVAEQQRTHGLITLEDLAGYQVKFRKPVQAAFGRYQVYSMPPPSSGGVHILEMLNIMEGFAPTAEPYSVRSIHETVSAMQIAYRDRAKYLGDSDFGPVPVSGLVSKAYAADWRRQITADKALILGSDQLQDPLKYESHDTTHFSIADSQGNVVASTQTINGWFGSGVVVRGAGLVMNNEMDDFSVKPGVPNKFGLIGGKENAIAAQKRPLSSMSPTIVTEQGKPVLALGSPSGSQIINCVLLTTLNYLAYRLPLWESITALRYHHQWVPPTLVVEAPGFSPALATSLKTLGYDVTTGGIGCKVQAIALEKDQLHGVSDPRGEGLAASEKPTPTSSSEGQGSAEPVVHD